jgi:hypothetical protein
MLLPSAALARASSRSAVRPEAICSTQPVNLSVSVIPELDDECIRVLQSPEHTARIAAGLRASYNEVVTWSGVSVADSTGRKRQDTLADGLISGWVQFF